METAAVRTRWEWDFGPSKPPKGIPVTNGKAFPHLTKNVSHSAQSLKQVISPRAINAASSKRL